MSTLDQPQTPPPRTYHLSENLISLASEHVEGKGYAVLFVDDEQLHLQSLSALFKNRYEVLTADSAKDAIEKLRSHVRVVCIVSDQRMPEMTGSDLFAAIKDQYPFTVRVLMTAYSETKVMEDSINFGGVFYTIRKPYSPEEMSEVVRRAVAVSLLMQRFEDGSKVREEAYAATT